MLLFQPLEMAGQIGTLHPQLLETAKCLEHEGVEVPALLFAAGERVGEEVEEHGFATSNFAVEEHALRGVDG